MKTSVAKLTHTHLTLPMIAVITDSKKTCHNNLQKNSHMNSNHIFIALTYNVVTEQKMSFIKITHTLKRFVKKLSI